MNSTLTICTISLPSPLPTLQALMDRASGGSALGAPAEAVTLTGAHRTDGIPLSTLTALISMQVSAKRRLRKKIAARKAAEAELLLTGSGGSGGGVSDAVNVSNTTAGVDVGGSG